jgi:hypothetical protein
MFIQDFSVVSQSSFIKFYIFCQGQISIELYSQSEEVKY